MKDEKKELTAEHMTAEQVIRVENPVDGNIVEFKKDSQKRNWLFTQNNPTMSDEELARYLENLQDIQYFLFCREKAPTTGTIHIQGYFEFSKPKRFSVICGYLPKTHFIPRGGTKHDQKLYIKKQGRFADKTDTQIGEVYEWGDIVEQGGRNDLKEIQFEIKEENRTPQELVLNRVMSEQQAKFAERVFREKNNLEFRYKKRDMTVNLYWGDTTTNITNYIYENLDARDFYRVTNYKNPFDDYEYQDILVLDNFDSKHFDIHTFMSYLNGFPVQLDCRYNGKMGGWSKVYIISQKPLYDMYSWDSDKNKLALQKLIHYTKCFNEDTLRTPVTELQPIDEDIFGLDF